MRGRSPVFFWGWDFRSRNSLWRRENQEGLVISTVECEQDERAEGSAETLSREATLVFFFVDGETAVAAQEAEVEARSLRPRVRVKGKLHLNAALGHNTPKRIRRGVRKKEEGSYR